MKQHFSRLERLPPYVFNLTGAAKAKALAAGADIIDFGLGNPDQPPAPHIVAKLAEAIQDDTMHRYGYFTGHPELRAAVADWYQQRYQVQVDPEDEMLVTIGSKEGIAHLCLACLTPGDTAIVPDPSYPIHMQGCVIAGADARAIPFHGEQEFLEELEQACSEAWPRPKLMILNFPSNPSAHCVDLSFFEKVIAFAKQHEIWVMHDFAYAEIAFDGFKPPSILQVKGAKDCAVETYSLSKTYNLPGWRIGFVSGCKVLVDALKRIKAYTDYGNFTPLQIAALTALKGPQDCVEQNRQLYQARRDLLCQGLADIGWPVAIPKASMFVWAKIPEQYQHLGSLEFSMRLLEHTNVAVAPGIGFGEHGESYVRFGLIQEPERINTALTRINDMLQHNKGI